MPGLDASAVLAIDGFEQLSLANRFRIKRFTSRRGIGLLVAAHAPVGLPPLWTTATDRDLARRIVGRLLDESEPRIAPEDVDAAFSRHEGNLRETLFALYDLYESRRR